MDIHLHDWRTKPILCKDLCAIFATIKCFTCLFVLIRWKWLFEESDWASWIAQKWKRLDVKNKNKNKTKHEITPQSKTKQSDECTMPQMTVGATPPHPLMPQNICSLKLYNWSDVRCRESSMSTPWGKNYIHETEVTGWLCVLVCVGMALRGITVPHFFRNIMCS